MTDGTIIAPLCLLLGGLILFGKVYYSRVGIIASVVVAITHYLVWRLTDTIDWHGAARDLWWPLTCLAVELAALFDGAILLALLSRPTDRSAEADRGEHLLREQWATDPSQLPAVDVFITTYNEPREVLEKTIVGAMSLEWPSARIWVLDDGRREWVRDLSAAKGAGYITRDHNRGAKAGNINHGLMVTQAPFVAVFDADFIPRRDFLLRTMGFFEQERIGIVQVPHSFYNHDPMQTNLGLEQAMPDDQRFFFEAIMPGRDGWDAAFCCGSNSVTRRSLFAQIGGGMPEGSITEDMLLTLASLRLGYITRYLNEPLAFGLAPESTAAFFVQRQRWAQGAIQIMHLKLGPFGPGLKLRHRLMFLPTAWITQGLQSAFTIIAPIMFLLFDMSPMKGVDTQSLFFYLAPMLVAVMGSLTLLAPRRYYPLAAQIMAMFQTFRILPVALQTLFRSKGLIFKVTPKGADAAGESWQKSILIATMTLIGLTVAGIAINMSPDYRIVGDQSLIGAVAFWSAINIALLLLVAMICLERPRMRGEERFPLTQPVTVLGQGGTVITSSSGDISLSGLGLDLAEDSGFAANERVQVVVADVGIVRGVVRRAGRRIGVVFDFQSEQLRDKLIVALFTGAMITNTQRPSTFAVALAMVQRLWSARLESGPTPIAAITPASEEVRLSPATRVYQPAKREPALITGTTEAVEYARTG